MGRGGVPRISWRFPKWNRRELFLKYLFLLFFSPDLHSPQIHAAKQKRKAAPSSGFRSDSFLLLIHLANQFHESAC